MTPLNCGELRDLSAELALGVLPGDERAAALAHLEHCGECRTHLEELSDAADALLLLAPQADPPSGFARRVTAELDPQRLPRRHRVTALAAAVVLVLGGAGALAAAVVHRGGHSKPAPFALHAPGVKMAGFVAAQGERVGGQVFTFAGTPSWVFMTVAEKDSSETYACELELSDGTRLRIGRFQLHNGSGSWGRTVPLDVSRIRVVRLINQSGETAASGRFA